MQARGSATIDDLWNVPGKAELVGGTGALRLVHAG